jgi:hypothetical protein
VVISTGKSDWDREVTEATGSLAAYLHEIQSKTSSPATAKSTAPEEGEKVVPAISGIFRTSDSTRISILNGSHDTFSDDCALETVLVFPDYKVVMGVSPSVRGAEGLWKTHINPTLGRIGRVLDQDTLNTWIIPYSCVILLCKL